MKKILIISYYWFPSGGSGVQRWLKFTKYLREFGWEPIIYTPKNPEYPSLDYSFEKDIPHDITILKTPIWEPYNIYRSFLNKKNETINSGFIAEHDKHSWKDKLSVWVRGNFFIPDPRKFWVKPSVCYLKKYLELNPVDIIVTTGPPHSLHFIGLKLKKIFPQTSWISDFRDPWTKVYYYKDLNLNFIADKINHHCEKKIIKNSDCVLVVSKGMKDDFKAISPKRIEIITNGYDSDDTSNIKKTLDKKFSISYIGLLTKRQNPILLWKVLCEICSNNYDFQSDLQINLIGKIDISAFESIKDFGLQNNLNKSYYLPHNEAIEIQQSSQVLLLLLLNQKDTKAILTGKIFEYLAAKRPILGIGPIDGDAASILAETEAGIMIDFADEKLMKDTILDYYRRYKEKGLTVNTESVERFSRRSLTRELAGLLNSL